MVDSAVEGQAEGVSSTSKVLEHQEAAATNEAAEMGAARRVEQAAAKKSDEGSTGQLAEAMRKASELETRLAARENEVNHKAELEAQEQRLLKQAATQQAMMLEEMTSAALLAWNEKQKEHEALAVAEKDETKRVWQTEICKRDERLEVKQDSAAKAAALEQALAKVAALEMAISESREEVASSDLRLQVLQHPDCEEREGSSVQMDWNELGDTPNREKALDALTVGACSSIIAGTVAGVCASYCPRTLDKCCPCRLHCTSSFRLCSILSGTLEVLCHLSVKG